MRRPIFTLKTRYVIMIRAGSSLNKFAVWRWLGWPFRCRLYSRDIMYRHVTVRIRDAHGWISLTVGALRRDSKLLQDALAENICVNTVNTVWAACLLVIGWITRRHATLWTLCCLIFKIQNGKNYYKIVSSSFKSGAITLSFKIQTITKNLLLLKPFLITIPYFF